jgi:hypothetical protein
MNDSIVKLPESFIFYVKKDNIGPMNLIDDMQAPADSFGWEEIGKFYQAKFALERTRYEFYMFMREVWDKTWGGLKKFTPCIVKEYGSNFYSVEYVWGHDSLEVMHTGRGEYSLYTGIGYHDDEEDVLKFSLYFYLGEGDSYDLAKDIKPKNWKLNDDNANCIYWETEPVRCAIKSRSNSIDVSVLQEAVKEAQKALRPYNTDQE